MSKTLFIIFIFFSQLQYCYSCSQDDPQVDNLESAQIQKNLSVDQINNSILEKREDDKISYILHGNLLHETDDKSDANLTSEAGDKLSEQHNFGTFLNSTYFSVRGILSNVKSLFYNKNRSSKKFICRLDLIKEKLEEVEKELRNGTAVSLNEYASSIVKLAFPDEQVYYTAAEISALYKILLGLNKFDTLLERNFKALYRQGKPHHKGTVLIGHYRCLGETLCFHRLTIKEALLKYKQVEAESLEIIKDRLDYFFYAPGHLRKD